MASAKGSNFALGLLASGFILTGICHIHVVESRNDNWKELIGVFVVIGISIVFVPDEVEVMQPGQWLLDK